MARSNTVLAVLLAVAAVSQALVPQSMPLAAADTPVATVSNRTYVFLPGEIFEYHPATGTWTTLLLAPGAMTGAAVVVNDDVVVLGGGGQFPQANCTVFSTTSKTLTACADMPNPRGFLGAAAVGTNVYALGGFAPKGWDLVDIFDASTGKWFATGSPLPTPRYGLCAVTLNGQIYTIGGVAWHMPSTPVVEVYDPNTDTWTQAASLNVARAYMGCTVLDNKIYVVAGNDGNENLNSVEVYDPSSNTWTMGEPLPKPTRSHTAAAAIDDYILVAGGSTGNQLQTRDMAQVDVLLPSV